MLPTYNGLSDEIFLVDKLGNIDLDHCLYLKKRFFLRNTCKAGKWSEVNGRGGKKEGEWETEL